MNAAFKFQSQMRQKGLTLVELLVAMVVGLGVIGAGLAMYVSSGVSSTTSSQITQMTEDANTALSLVRTHVAMAGYSRPVGTSSTGLTKLLAGPVIFGCQNGLSSTSTSRAITKGATLTCDTGAPSSKETLIVRYEADTSNTVPNSDNVGTDCLGNSVPGINDTTYGSGTYYVAENRFYLSSTGSLYCRGNGASAGNDLGSPQALVENIADFAVTYGVASDTTGTTSTPGTFATRYLTATQIGDMSASAWNNVVSVRLCVVVRSEDNALDDIKPYTDCHGNNITPTTWGSPAKADRRSYRLFTSTVVLHNRAQQTLE